MEDNNNSQQKVNMNNNSEFYSEVIPREMTLSKHPWVPVTKRPPENRNRRTEKDPADELALRFNFEESNPSLDTIRRRAVYRPHLDFNCRPEGQDWILITTYGPDPAIYDVPRKRSGWFIWGFFKDEKECSDHVRYIRDKNPHMVFIPIRPLYLTGPIDFPPTNDGSTEDHILNKEHAEFMKKYLAKEVRAAEYVDQRKEETIEQSKKGKLAAEELDKTLKEIYAVPGETSDVLDRFEEYHHNPESGVVTPGLGRHRENTSFDQLTEELDSIYPSMVDAVIKFVLAGDIPLPPNYKKSFQIYKRQSDGKPVLVKVITKTTLAS